MLKVLQLIPTLDRSGAEKQMALLACGLPRDRFRVEVAALTRKGPLEAELLAAGIPVTLIGKRHKLDPLALGRLIRFMKAGRFDVVHTWIFAGNTYGRVAAWRAGVPVIVTAEMAVDQWKGPRHLAIDRWLGRRTDCVVGNSKAVAEFYRQAGVPEDRLAVIYSGIADERPQAADATGVRAALGIEPGAPLAVFAGRLAPQKGVEDLIRALDLLQHVRPDLRTLVVGNGPLRDHLEGLVQAFQLGSAVRFLGHRDDVPRLIDAADVLVLPSYYEGLPNVVLEAMQAGKPVVATEAPGTTEVVVDRETGLLVPLRNPPALAEAIRTVIEQPELARRLGEAGRARVASVFRADTMIGQFAELYERLARAKGLSV